MTARPEGCAGPRQGFGTVRIRPAAAGDAPDLARLHGDALPRAWPAESFAEAIAAPGSAVLAAVRDGVPLGVLVWRDLLGEAEILTLAVAVAVRRQGIASLLVRAALAAARQAGASAMHLEVAASNRAAIGLYERCGFGISGRRAGYYPADGGGREDACLMRHDGVAQLDGAGARS